MTRTLEEFREAIDEAILSVPLHRQLGISIERAASREARVVMPPLPEIVAADGGHSPAAVYLIGDVAAGVRLCDEIAPRAVEMEMAAMFLTVSASFQPAGPVSGALEAIAELTKGFDEGQEGDRPLRKATLEVAARVTAESGEPAGEQRVRFYVRFMEPSRMRAMAPESSQLIRILGT